AGRFDLLDGLSDTTGDLSSFEGRRVLLIEKNPAVADALAQELRALSATVVVADGEGAGLERARTLGPEIVIVDEQGIETWAFGVMRRIRRDPILRWASVLVIRAEELMPRGEPPRTDRLAGSAALLVAADNDLVARARTEKSLDLRLEAIGALRMVRALAQANATMHLTIKSRRATVELDIAEGLVAGAEATFPAGGPAPVGGSAAVAALLALSVGRVHVERRVAPSMANLLTPIDEAFMRAATEESPIRPSVPPSEPPPQAEVKNPQPPIEGKNAELVTELRSLVSQLKASLPAGAPSEPVPMPFVPRAPMAPRQAQRTMLGLPVAGGLPSSPRPFRDEAPTAPVEALSGTEPISAPALDTTAKQAYKPPAPRLGIAATAPKPAVGTKLGLGAPAPKPAVGTKLGLGAPAPKPAVGTKLGLGAPPKPA
ncbi:MAG: hypothetical protein H5U40_00140, partial [Polyangiaceae bacterium]|nr:hypothetical protein [Polyangiaceae bacterium]